MKILILGGTHFLGRHIVEHFLQLPNSYEIILFHRGKTNPNLFKETYIQSIHGDRQTQPELIKDVKPDVVIDCCGHFPTGLEKLANVLQPSNPYYIYISTGSVYDTEKDKVHTDERTALLSTDIPDDKKDDPSMEYYGVRKLLCERVVQKHFQRHCIIRPGLIVGEYDSTFRFPYWIKRLSEQGEILAPDGPDCSTQFIDAKDIAVWITKLIHDQPNEIFDAVGDALTIGQFLETAQTTLQNQSKISYVPEEFLKEQQIGCWMEIPLWVYKEMEIFLKRSNDKAKAAGLKIRPIEKTIKEVKKWLDMSQNLPDDSYNLSRDKEKLVLEKYHATRK